jgi:hypothetical protein
VWRDTTFAVGTTNNVFTFKRKTKAGCDSTVTLNLTVSDVINESQALTICQNELPKVWRDTIFQVGSTSRTVIFNKKTAAGCDSIVTLNLTVMEDIDVSIGVPALICADDGDFTLTISQNSTTSLVPTHYKISFEPKEVAAGFYNQEGEISGSEIIVEMPKAVYPDNYSFKIVLSQDVNECPDKEFEINYAVLYPDSIMEQKWDDVIAILNEYFNGGFKFSAYQWFHNGDKMNGEEHSYIYLNGKSLTIGDEYSVLITREDGSQIFSCPFVARAPRTEVSNIPTVVVPGQVIKVSVNSDAEVRLWSVTGVLVAAERVETPSKDITMPSQQGVYILEIITDNALNRTAIKIVVSGQ